MTRLLKRVDEVEHPLDRRIFGGEEGLLGCTREDDKGCRREYS